MKESAKRQKIKKNVAKILRKEIKNTLNTFQQWPPSEDEFLSSETDLRSNLKVLLTALLTDKIQTSAGKEKKIDPLGMDIIYCVNNGSERTTKHVLVSLQVKRKTGSKEVVNWLNKLGHGISYDKVRYLETSLGIQQTKQKILKTLVPSIIQPSRFVTFVWDNNDVNPESLTGVNMHCTNGIMVQLIHTNDQPIT